MKTWMRMCAAVLLSMAVAQAKGETAVRALRMAFVHDSQQHAAAGPAERNHWDVYLREILDQLGARAEEVSPAVLHDPEGLKAYATILLGNLSAETLSAQARNNLHAWIRGGGTLVAFSTPGIDDICGNRHMGKLDQTPDPFTCTASFALKPHRLTAEVHSPLHPDQRLLIFSDAQKVKAEESSELARLYDLHGEDTGYAAVTARQLEQGHAFYFAFSVPQTMWVLHQGRPVDRDYDGDNMLRHSDAIVIRPHSIEVAYADELLFLLQNMIATHSHPLIHQLPPLPSDASDGEHGKGRVPDALFYWGGDDEGSIDGIQLAASDWMKQHALPYHINAMIGKSGQFGLSVEDAEKIRANGHEIAPHFNFMRGFPATAGFTRQDVLAQANAFRRHFASGWTCSVNHCCRWTGWAEPAQWMQEAGGKADNSFTHSPSPPPNPVNMLGFASGTAFPFWFYDDWRSGNRKIDFLEEPITAFECGYLKDQTDFGTVHKAIDCAARYHLTMNMFYHPVYIARQPACRAAIEEALRYLKARQIRALHFGNDQLYAWWKARTDTRLTAVTVQDNSLGFQVESESPTGVVIKIPLARKRAKSLTIGGVARPSDLTAVQYFGQRWAFVVVPRGKTSITLVTEELPGESAGIGE